MHGWRFIDPIHVEGNVSDGTLWWSPGSETAETIDELLDKVGALGPPNEESPSIQCANIGRELPCVCLWHMAANTCVLGVINGGALRRRD